MRVIALMDPMSEAGTETGDSTTDAQHGAVNDYCARKKWKLVGLHEVRSPDDRARAIDAVQRGEADVLLAVVHTALWSGAREALEFLKRGLGHFDFVIIGSGFDTTTPHGRLLVERMVVRMQSELRPSSQPLPPSSLVRRVIGSPDIAAFEASGALDLRDFLAGLARAGRSIDDCRDIYDFGCGCGCGRLLRHLLPELPHARLSGSDIDAPAIDWLRENLPTVDARVNDPLPPLPFGDQCFDLVLGYSVFTHLDEKYQDAWLGELRRVARPGAILLLTIQGEIGWQLHAGTTLAGRDELSQLASELEQRGIAHWRSDGWEDFFPDFYHTTFHSAGYVHDHWSRWFDVIEMVPGGVGLTQDLVVLRRR